MADFWGWLPLDDQDESVCTVWTGPKDKDGYGQFSNSLGFSQYAHRVINEILHGKIPDGQQVLHRCDNPSCMRDSHHWRGTQADNMKDMSIKGRACCLGLKGEKSGSAILTEAKVLEIRELASKGASKWALARGFKISAYTAYAVVARRIWTQV
jgi:hypothetical protein